MKVESIFAGFGGQGIMLIGQMLAYAGMDEDRNVVWLPSYGPEMRGGTAYCTVVVSDNAIGSPVLDRLDVVSVLNRPSLEKFAPRVKAGGLLITNTSLIDIRSDREDIDKLDVPANDIAMECGNGKAANMAILGAFVGATGAIQLESLHRYVEKQFAKKPKLIDLNVEVLARGHTLGQELELGAAGKK